MDDKILGWILGVYFLPQNNLTKYSSFFSYAAAFCVSIHSEAIALYTVVNKVASL